MPADVSPHLYGGQRVVWHVDLSFLAFSEFFFIEIINKT
jgi:hypothetical protein